MEKNTKEEEFKMRRVKLVLTALAATIAMNFTAYAGQWQQDSTGWWYQNDDGSYPASQWQEIEGKHYYFGVDGYMLSNTTTPDGYQVGADGAWVDSTQQVQTIINVEGLSPQQNGYDVTYQYFNAFDNGYGKAEYQAIIEIQNTSAGNLYLGTATFDIYDRSGNIVASESFISRDPSVIAPGEKGYYYSNGGYLDNVPMGDYVMRPTITVEPTNLPATRYEVTNTSIKDGMFGVTVLGNVTNNSTEDEGILWICIALFDSNNQPIGLYGTNILDFNVEQTRGFEASGMMLPDYVGVNDVARYEVIAAPTQYQF